MANADQASVQAVQQEAGAVDAEVAQQREDELGAAAPPADEPLEAETLNMLSEAVAEATNALMGENLIQPIAVEGDQEAVPGPLFAQLQAIAGFLSESGIPEAEPFQFDVFQSSLTNAGVMEMANIMMNMGTDEQLKRALSSPPPEQAAPEAPAAPTGPSDEEQARFL